MPLPSESNDSMKSTSSKSRQLSFDAEVQSVPDAGEAVGPDPQANQNADKSTRQASPTQRLLKATLSKLRTISFDDREDKSTKVMETTSHNAKAAASFRNLPNSPHESSTPMSEPALLMTQQLLMTEKPLRRTMTIHADSEAGVNPLMRRMSRSAMGATPEGLQAGSPNTQHLHVNMKSQQHYSTIPVGTGLMKVVPEDTIESVSFDRMPDTQQRYRQFSNEETELVLPEVSSRSFSEGCIRPAAECTELNMLSDRGMFLHKGRCQMDECMLGEDDLLMSMKASRVKTASTETIPRTPGNNVSLQTPRGRENNTEDFGLQTVPLNEVDDFGLPIVSNPQLYNSSATEQGDSHECSPLSTPPVSRCNSAAWSGDSFNGSDSWEDLRTESQVMNSVNQTIRHELANVQRMQNTNMAKVPVENGNGPPTIEYKPGDSEENVWRTLRDKARATLPPLSPTPPHGRTIETQVPLNWPPRHGLHFQVDKPQKVLRRRSSSSSDVEETVDNCLSTYLQHSVSYVGDSGPRLVDRPSVELIEGTLLAKWCKKDNRTWLWKSSRRWRRFNGFLAEPTLHIQPPDGHNFAKRWKKDNRTWLWKSSIHRRDGLRITEIAN